jgi:hypothetical protein
MAALMDNVNITVEKVAERALEECDQRVYPPAAEADVVLDDGTVPGGGG